MYKRQSSVPPLPKAPIPVPASSQGGPRSTSAPALGLPNLEGASDGTGGSPRATPQSADPGTVSYTGASLQGTETAIPKGHIHPLSAVLDLNAAQNADAGVITTPAKPAEPLPPRLLAPTTAKRIKKELSSMAEEIGIPRNRYFHHHCTVSYTHLTLPTILRV